MTEQNVGIEPAYADDDEISLLALGSVLLRWRRTIFALGLVGAAAGLSMGLTSTRMYVSTATFIPGSESAASGLALAASQFGIRVPSSSGTWQPPMYVELLHSRVLLGPIALDTVVVAEEGGRRTVVMDLLEVGGPTLARRTDLAVIALKGIITATEDKKLNAVNISVSTKWPSISLALAERLLHGVNRFNLETRKSQATAERQFAEVQAREAEHALRAAEDRMLLFFQQNRNLGSSPELTFQKDRLQRDVALRQQVYTALSQNREEARIREVRDTPVITVLEGPQLASAGEPRRSVFKGMLGGVIGGLIGVLFSLLAREVIGTRRAPSENAQEFFQVLDESIPQFLRRGKRS